MNKILMSIVVFLVCLGGVSCHNPVASHGTPAPKILLTAGNDLCLVNQQGDNFQVVYSGASNQYEAQWSPDEQHIVLTDMREENQEVYQINLTGEKTDNISQNTFFNEDPMYTPAGDAILFVTSIDWINHLRLRQLGDHKLVELWQGHFFAPKMSPDGIHLACNYSPESGSSGVYLFNRHSRQLQFLAKGNVLGFSPTGTKILYDRFAPPDRYQLHIIDTTGENEHTLTDIPPQTVPHFSPDGTHIVFTKSTVQQPADIYQVNEDGTALHNLTESPDWNEAFPIYYPDGSKILFVRSGKKVSAQLCALDLDTGEIAIILQDVGHIVSPAFQPQPK